jgi:hypothetical protein
MLLIILMAGEYIFILNNVNNTRHRRVQCLQFFDVNDMFNNKSGIHQIPLQLINKGRTIISNVEINTNCSTVENTRSASSSVTPRNS